MSLEACAYSHCHSVARYDRPPKRLRYVQWCGAGTCSSAESSVCRVFESMIGILFAGQIAGLLSLSRQTLTYCLAESNSEDDKSDVLWPEYALGTILRPL